MKSRMALVVTALAAGLALSACGDKPKSTAAVEKETFTFRYATPIAQGSLSGQAAEWFAQEVKDRSDGRVVFQNYHAGTLMAPGEMLGSLTSGNLAAAYVTPAYWPKNLPLYDITSTGFLTSDGIAVAQAVNELQENNTLLQEELSKQGIKLLFPFFGSIAALGTAEPVESLSDLSGLRLRGAGRSGEAYAAAGVEIVAVPAPEIYEQVQRKVLNGFALWPYDIITAAKLHEVAPHIYDTGVGMYSHASYAMSLAAWNRLPEDLKKIVTEVAAEYTEKMGAQALLDEERKQCEQLKAAGAKVVEWPESQKKQFTDLAHTSQLASWAKNAESGGYTQEQVESFKKAYLETYNEFSKDSPYASPMKNCSAS